MYAWALLCTDVLMHLSIIMWYSSTRSNDMRSIRELMETADECLRCCSRIRCQTRSIHPFWLLRRMQMAMVGLRHAHLHSFVSPVHHISPTPAHLARPLSTLGPT